MPTLIPCMHSHYFESSRHALSETQICDLITPLSILVSQKKHSNMKLIVILAGLFAVVAVAHAYSPNMLEALLQIMDNVEQDKPSMEIQGQ